MSPFLFFFNPPCLSSEATPPKQNQHQQPQIMEVVTSMQRHKILTLTKTYLTLSLVEIANEAGLSNTREAEDILFDMISEGEIKAQQLGWNHMKAEGFLGLGSTRWKLEGGWLVLFCGSSWEFLFCLKVAFVGLGCWFIKFACVSTGFGLDFVVVKPCPQNA